MTKNKLLSFVSEFANCLNDAAWLPFVADPFRAVLPDIADTHPTSRLCQFFVRQHEATVGILSIIPSFESRLLLITNLNTRLQDDGLQRRGLGREVLRRIVRYAEDHNCSRVSTTAWRPGAGSFWLSMGFRSAVPVDPIWYFAKGFAAEEVHPWKKPFESKEASVEHIWKLAQSEIGRKVLWCEPGGGCLGLDNEAQRHRAYRRLMLG